MITPTTIIITVIAKRDTTGIRTAAMILETKNKIYNDYSSIHLTMTKLPQLDVGGVVGHGSDIESLESGHSTNADPLVKIQYLSR